MILALIGEAGEMANAVKKILRTGESVSAVSPPELLEHVAEELIDVLIYAGNIAAILGTDLTEEYLKKRAFNAERFGCGTTSND
jgi:NTP pyrophosphatase (non-canonical NTP hydrolase)